MFKVISKDRARKNNNAYFYWTLHTFKNCSAVLVLFFGKILLQLLDAVIVDFFNGQGARLDHLQDIVNDYILCFYGIGIKPQISREDVETSKSISEG